MTLPAHYPPANQTAQPRPEHAGGGTISTVEKLCLHTTETAGWPGYPTFAPHLTYNPWTREWHQHFTLNRSASTLADPSSTAVRENRDGIIQVEIVAYCDPALATRNGHFIDDISDGAVSDLAEFAAWLHTEGGLELALAPAWIPYAISKRGGAKNRMSGPQFDAFRGVLGHEHVSGNDHLDPGGPPWISDFLTIAKSKTDTEEHFMSTDIPYLLTPKQALKVGRNEVLLKEGKDDRTIVFDATAGADVRATIKVTRDGLDVPEGSYLAYFSIVSYKEGSTTTVSHNRKGTRGDQVQFAGSISAIPGRSPRLRLVVEALVDGLTLEYAEITGWKK
jgi:hypothetical protein